MADVCVGCHKKGELSFLGNCSCKDFYVCFDCYSELMGPTLFCTFCREKFPNVIFKDLSDEIGKRPAPKLGGRSNNNTKVRRRLFS